MNREKTIYGEYFHYPAATDWEKISARPHLDTQQLAEVVKMRWQISRLMAMKP